MIKVTVEFPTAEDAIEGLARLRGIAGAPAAPAPVKDKATTGKSAATAAPAASPATATATPAAAAEKKPDATSAGSVASAYDPVKAAISAAAKTNRAAVVATLGEFGAKAGTDLKPEQYDAFTAKLAAALAPPDGDLG